MLFTRRLLLSIHKKGDKQCLKNYRPISLLPICSKMFESVIYDELFPNFTDKLVSSIQSGFKPGDSCVNQLLVITHEIYEPFDDEFEKREVF